VHVKICGITTVEDAVFCVKAGATALGLNFVPASPRAISLEVARAIAASVEGKVLVVGVVANMTVERMRLLRDDVPLGCLQLHGDEPPEVLQALLPHAYKAFRVADARDVDEAERFLGDYVLVDAKVAGALGGTGQVVDPGLVRELARRRRLTLAGGLTPETVAEAIRAVQPYCVDVASGVESSPGKKDPEKVIAFVRAARASFESLAPAAPSRSRT
jgi:phosphoribosylanthranilate isomerase